MAADGKVAQRTPVGSAGRALSLRSVLRQMAWPLLVTYAFLPATFLIPIIDSTREPYFDLTSGVATVLYWAAQSGSVVGAPIVGSWMLLLLITRNGISSSRRILELAIVVGVVAICAGGGSALNEHVVKVAFKVPRPNIVYLAGENGGGLLGMSTAQFYAGGDKEARTAILRKVLEAAPPPVPMSPAIREHWLKETGYSFPSGHAFAAFFFAAFFLAMSVSYIATRRRWLFYLLLPWAVAVAYSRPILRVHTPTDITVGGLEGLVLGLAAFFLVRAGLTSWSKRFR
jgi:phosphatidylglycerophosphatase B